MKSQSRSRSNLVDCASLCRTYPKTARAEQNKVFKVNKMWLYVSQRRGYTKIEPLRPIRAIHWAVVCSGRESNPQPLDYDTDALTTTPLSRKNRVFAWDADLRTYMGCFMDLWDDFVLFIVPDWGLPFTGPRISQFRVVDSYLRPRTQHTATAFLSA